MYGHVPQNGRPCCSAQLVLRPQYVLVSVSQCYVAHACVRRGDSCNAADPEVKVDRIQLHLISRRAGGQKDLVLPSRSIVIICS